VQHFGYPGMATPFGQRVGVQVMLNVVTGKRCDTVPDDVIHCATLWRDFTPENCRSHLPFSPSPVHQRSYNNSV
jgi:hypothetical protein